MVILFLVALVLAWPTAGLSLVAWLALALLGSKAKVTAIEKRQQMAQIISPLFGDAYGEFYEALDVPHLVGRRPSAQDSAKCGRHIMNYLAHNPEEASAFMTGLSTWKTKGSQSLCDPVTAAKCESQSGVKAEIHVTSYRAMEALMINNPTMRCFDTVDFGRLVEWRESLELQERLAA